jgi:cell division septation protein DedD
MGTAKEKSGNGKHMIVMSRGYALLLSGFLLFLLFWVFVLGVLVGKGVIAGTMFDIKYPIQKIKALVGIKERVEYEKPREGSLDFYSELQRKKKDAKTESLIPAEEKIPDQKITLSKEIDTPKPEAGNEVRGVITPPVTTEDEAPQGQDAIQTSAVVTQEETQAVSSNEEAPVQTEPAPPAEQSAGQYSVQIAAITDREMAEKMAKELVDRGYDAYYYTATISGKKTYRIMCGRFSERSDAIACHERLKNELGYNGFISKVETE